MDEVENPLIKLQDLSKFLEAGSLDDNLQQLATVSSKILSAENCSIMLLNDGESENMRMSVCACHGSLPAAAYKELIGKGDGIAGHVIATGQSLLIEDIDQSKFAKRARRTNDPRKSLMSSPITISGRIVGVVNVSGPTHGDTFSLADLNLLDVVALFIGKSIQVVQLQSILNSRFAQLAMVQEAKKNMGGSLGSAFQNPDQVAKILAKSFFREMTRAGFGSSQIINAASEIIHQLSSNLQRHSKRINREVTEHSDKKPSSQSGSPVEQQ
jgi:L-methionine (R)-S-oxide reductase